MIRNRYKPMPYFADGTQGRHGPKRGTVPGRWAVIAAEMGPGMAVEVGNLNEAKMLQRACRKRGLYASTITRKGEPFRVVVP